MPDEQQKPSRNIGRKIWYGTVIFLSAFVLLISLVGVVGTWVVQRSLSDAAVSILGVVNDTAGSLRVVGQKIDQSAGEVRQISTNVSSVSQKISQNVGDQGLLALLLPPEQEQKLTGLVQNIQDTFTTIREALAAGMALYQSIDRLPFVSLPKPGMETITSIEEGVTSIQTTIQELRASVQEFRAGAADKIGLVTAAADRVTDRLDQLSTRLATLDSDLANLQSFATQMQQTIPTILFWLAILFTLLFAYLIYSQVEMILLFTQRWKALNPKSIAIEAGASAEAVEPGSE